MGKMETTTSLTIQNSKLKNKCRTLDIKHHTPRLKPTPSVGSLTYDCTKGDNNKFLLVKCFNEHIKLFKTVIVNSNYKFGLYII